LFALRPWITPQLQEDLNREFLRACRVVYHPCNDAGDALVLSAESCLEIEGLDSPRAFDCFASCVHVRDNAAHHKIVTAFGALDPVPCPNSIRNCVRSVMYPFAAQQRGHAASTAASGAAHEPVDARYRVLVEQIPAVVFMVYLDVGAGEVYVSPRIERTLGFSQSEWMADPVLWYRQIHPDDKERWSVEAARMFRSGTPLKSAYRLMSRDGRVVWLHCEAKMVRHEDGSPWFVHGVGFDITEVKKAEEALEEERDVLSAILDTVGALIVVLDPEGRIARFNRTAEQTTGYTVEEVRGKRIRDLFLAPEDHGWFQSILDRSRARQTVDNYESYWVTKKGERRLISWSTAILPDSNGSVRYVIATGIDVTERKRLEGAILDISNREQRRIGQDLHDGLGQHLTGVAFMAKVLQENLAKNSPPDAAAACRIVQLVNQAIHKSKELSRGLHPVLDGPDGLSSALQQFAVEVEDLFGVTCTFTCRNDPVSIPDPALANHLYRIAQEAVHNGIKHGRARHIAIALTSSALEVEDDGEGIGAADTVDEGMGLRIMKYRAGMIGGKLEIGRRAESGTRVLCTYANGGA